MNNESEIEIPKWIAQTIFGFVGSLLVAGLISSIALHRNVAVLAFEQSEQNTRHIEFRRSVAGKLVELDAAKIAIETSKIELGIRVEQLHEEMHECEGRLRDLERGK